MVEGGKLFDTIVYGGIDGYFDVLMYIEALSTNGFCSFKYVEERRRIGVVV